MGLIFSFEEVENALSKLDRKLKNDISDKALDAGVKPVLKELDKNVPVDTGELSDSLGEQKRTGTGAKRKVELGSTSKDRRIVERAYYQEHGHSSMIGKKWMKRSFQNSKDKALEAIGESIAKELMK